MLEKRLALTLEAPRTTCRRAMLLGRTSSEERHIPAGSGGPVCSQLGAATGGRAYVRLASEHMPCTMRLTSTDLH